MANHDYVFRYVESFKGDLEGMGFSVPAVAAGCRFPAEAEVREAIEQALGLKITDHGKGEFTAAPAAAGGDQVLHVACRDWKRLGEAESDCFTLRGELKLELKLLEKLSHACGQLVLHPDTGDPPLVVCPGIDVPRLAGLHRRAELHAQPWEYFFSEYPKCLPE